MNSTATKRQDWFWAVGAAVASAAFFVSTAAGQVATGKPAVRTGLCDREAPKLVGQEPVHVGPRSKIVAPKRLRNVQPTYPPAKEPHTGSGVWMGEALIDTSGRVHRVWALREPNFTPPWPEFSEAIVAAINRWLYEPTVVDGRPVPVCMTVTVGILWQ